MMCLVAAVLTLVVILIELLDNGRQMRLSENCGFVLIVQNLCTQIVDVDGITDILRMDRLTAAGDAAAGNAAARD